MFTQRPNRPFSLDALNRTLLIGGFAASLLARFFADRSLGNYIFLGISTASLIFAAVRLLGGNPQRRAQENLKFLTLVTAVQTFFRNLFKKKASATIHQKQPKKAKKHPTWAELKQYKYFICPQCTQRLRVPRGKGKLRVTCTRCGNKFETKS